MQCNQAFGNYGYQNTPSYGFQSNQQAVSPNPQIIGEGDVVTVTYPDGSYQFYFVPIIRHDNLPYYCNIRNPYGPVSWPINTQAWIVRSIAHPQGNINTSTPHGYCNGQLPCSFGECPLAPCTSIKFYENKANNPEFLQKFHNDTWTSTTDIHYFYPSLRKKKNHVLCSIETQTELLFQNSNLYIGDRGNTLCHCRSVSVTREKNPTNVCDCQRPTQTKSSVSSMSIDSRNGFDEGKNIKYRKRVNRSKKNKRVHICECKTEIKGTSDKFVTTYVDQGTGNVVEGGRGTQTDMPRSKKGGSQTELWLPSKNSTLTILSTCRNCCNTGSCSCTSGTDHE